MKDYANTTVIKEEFHYIETRVPKIFFRMSGISKINLWGGGSDSIKMASTTFEADKLTKEVIYENLNDGQFGCESIQSAKVYIVQEYEVTRDYISKSGSIIDSEVHTEWESIINDLYVSVKDIK